MDNNITWISVKVIKFQRKLQIPLVALSLVTPSLKKLGCLDGTATIDKIDVANYANISFVKWRNYGPQIPILSLLNVQTPLVSYNDDWIVYKFESNFEPISDFFLSYKCISYLITILLVLREQYNFIYSSTIHDKFDNEFGFT